jgi:molecular chaperone DnaK (HSP70)
MNLIGIDIGGSKIVLQKMNPSGPEVLLSPSSSRSVPNLLAFSPSERFLLSDLALNKLKTIYTQTVQFPHRCLRTYDQ